MASPQKLAVKLCSSVSPRSFQNTVQYRQLLSPKTPVADTCGYNLANRSHLSPFNIDTPNRVRILEKGLPEKRCKILGSGRFGTVYKASYKGDQVAAKVMQTRRCTDAIFNSEKQASYLRHSNIVKILTVEQGASLSLITMELCGTSLQDRLDEAVLCKNERINVLRAIACALQFCHDAGIVHADVKPKNILMADDGQPKLTDFGSSVLTAGSYEINELCGTPGYMAPEILKGKKPTPAADIYSLGVVAWQMISRSLPFAGLHIHTIIYLSAKGNRPKDEDLDDDFHGKYKMLYRKMWSQSIVDRPVANEIISNVDRLIEN